MHRAVLAKFSTRMCQLMFCAMFARQRGHASDSDAGLARAKLQWLRWFKQAAEIVRVTPMLVARVQSKALVQRVVCCVVRVVVARLQCCASYQFVVAIQARVEDVARLQQLDKDLTCSMQSVVGKPCELLAAVAYATMERGNQAVLTRLSKLGIKVCAAAPRAECSCASRLHSPLLCRI